MILDSRLIDHVYRTSALQHLDADSLLALRKPIGKMKLLALYWRTILDLHRQRFACQMEDRGPVHLPLPHKLRPVLSV